MGEGEDGQSKEDAICAVLEQGPLPELIVFDLDYTCWPCYVDALTGPPFTYDEARGIVLDRRKWEVELYSDVRALLLSLEKLAGPTCKIAVASRTDEPDWAREVLKLIRIDDTRCLDDFLHAREIYPGSKREHFKRLSEGTGVSLSSMLFFDDEHRNIQEVSRMGVTCYHCEDGLSVEAFTEGLHAFRRRVASGQM